jgi:hypothetical protein
MDVILGNQTREKMTEKAVEADLTEYRTRASLS